MQDTTYLTREKCQPATAARHRDSARTRRGESRRWGVTGVGPVRQTISATFKHGTIIRFQRAGRIWSVQSLSRINYKSNIKTTNPFPFSYTRH